MLTGQRLFGLALGLLAFLSIAATTDAAVWRDLERHGTAFNPGHLIQNEPVERPYQIEVGTRSNHPNGTQLFVQDAVVHDSYIEVNLQVINGYPHTVTLNASNDLHLVDDQGTVYRLVPAAEDRQLRIDANEVLEGALVFVGHVADNAQSMDLMINAERGSLEDTREASPAFVVSMSLADKKKP